MSEKVKPSCKNCKFPYDECCIVQLLEGHIEWHEVEAIGLRCDAWEATE